MAQLPAFSIEQTTPLPISESYFVDLCSRFLDEQSAKVISLLSLEPSIEPVKTGSYLLDSWYDWERSVRFALAEIRAGRLKKDFKFTLDQKSKITITPEILQVARTASGFESPLEAEQYLNAQRVNVLEHLMPFDAFAPDAVFAYGLKLKLASRIQKFNQEAGKASYRKIYDTILGESI